MVTNMAVVLKVPLKKASIRPILNLLVLLAVIVMIHNLALWMLIGREEFVLDNQCGCRQVPVSKTRAESNSSRHRSAKLLKYRVLPE